MLERILSIFSLAALVGCVVVAACGPCKTCQQATAEIRPAERAIVPETKETQTVASSGKVVRTEEQWRKTLTPEQYRVLREKGTERAFTGKYWDTTTPGVYKCAACGAVLFSSDAKFDSHCGWPSFDRMIAAGTIEEHADDTLGMHRVEVVCAHCGGHLGHVFPDGPTDTGMRYCINSASIELQPGATKPDQAAARQDNK